MTFKDAIEKIKLDLVRLNEEIDEVEAAAGEAEVSEEKPEAQKVEIKFLNDVTVDLGEDEKKEFKKDEEHEVELVANVEGEDTITIAMDGKEIVLKREDVEIESEKEEETEDTEEVETENKEEVTQDEVPAEEAQPEEKPEASEAEEETEQAEK